MRYTLDMNGTSFINPDTLVASPAFSHGAIIPPGFRLLETGGINGVNRDGRVTAPGDIGAQTTRALEGVEAILTEAGARREHIYRVRIAVVEGVELHPGFLAWGRFWQEQRHQPVITVTVVRSLVVPDALVEIEVSAAIPEDGLNDSSIAMWLAFLGGCEEGRRAAAAGARPRAWAFGSGEEMETELAELVMAGTKRATASSMAALLTIRETPPAVDDYSIIYNGRREAQCVIRTTALHVAPLESVTDEFARREGEGDRTRASWLDGHRRFFSAEHEELGLPFDDAIQVLFEEFLVVWPREIADSGT